MRALFAVLMSCASAAFGLEPKPDVTPLKSAQVNGTIDG